MAAELSPHALTTTVTTYRWNVAFHFDNLEVSHEKDQRYRRDGKSDHAKGNEQCPFRVVNVVLMSLKIQFKTYGSCKIIQNNLYS